MAHPHTHTATEESLLTVATQAAIGTVRKVGRRVRHYWDMDGAEPRDRERDLARPLREFRYHWTRTGRFSFTGELDPDTGTLIEQLMVPLAAPDATDPSGTPDPRTPAERHGDAFTAIIELAAHTPDLPIKAGERAVATITINLHDLQNTAKTVLLDDGTAQPISVIRRMLCDAKIYPAVLGGDGQVLDLGRSARTAPPSLRRALAIRDRGCTFPGCPLGPKWTDVHHTTHWAHGGTTDPTTCTLTCTRHHRLAHHSNWTITITNNTVYWTPPTLIDPHQKPLRNTAHDPPPTQMRAA
ncbi:MAG TPA: DUF222 domain-containing protein [Amycolatopsis sp.]|nr:DUF222 domain-containing protein [Amycolatopsis sp.]